MNIRRWAWVSGLGLALATAAVYAPSLRGGFVYDDHWAIQRNSALELAPIWLFWADPGTGANPLSGLTKDIYRPLTVCSFALSLKVWGKHLAFWRLENLTWHLLNGFLFALLLRRLGFPSGVGAMFAVAVFLLHPMQVSSVAWIYQRSTLISAAGCLAALLLAIHPGLVSMVRLGGMLFFLTAALFAKESAIVFPFLLWIVSAKETPPAIRRFYVGCSALCVAGFFALRAMLLGRWSQISDLPRGWLEKGILTLMALPQYVAKFFVPWGLRASYDLPSISLSRIVIASSGMLLLFFYAYRLFRSRTKDWKFALWALLALAPMLPAAPIRAFFAERFFYLASMGVAASLGLFIQAQRAWRWPAVMWLMGISVLTVRYAGAWTSDAALWPWTVQREPSNAFAHMCMAETLSDPQKAQVQYFKALVNHPSLEMTLAAWNNLAVLALAQHQPKKALYWTAQVLKVRPQMPQALYNRWRALKNSGDLRQADRLRRTLIKDPRIPASAFHD